MAFRPFSPKKEVPEPVKEIPVPKPSEPAKPKEVWEVVAELPVQQIRRAYREDGAIINYITVAEYLTQQANVGIE